MTLKFDGWPQETIGYLFYTTSSFVHHFKSISAFKLELQSGNAQLGSKLAIFVHCDLTIWWMTLENKRAPLLYYIKLCASFQSHRWIQTGVTVRKCSIWVKISNFLIFKIVDFSACVTLKFDGWSPKIIGHLFYITSSFVHHLKSLDEFKLELLSGNAQFGSKLAIFCPMWPWNLMDDLEQGKSEGFDSWDRPSNLTQIGLKSSIFRPCDLEIWWMTPKNNKARVLYYIKL